MVSEVDYSFFLLAGGHVVAQFEEGDKEQDLGFEFIEHAEGSFLGEVVGHLLELGVLLVLAQADIVVDPFLQHSQQDENVFELPEVGLDELERLVLKLDLQEGVDVGAESFDFKFGLSEGGGAECDCSSLVDPV